MARGLDGIHGVKRVILEREVHEVALTNHTRTGYHGSTCQKMPIWSYETCLYASIISSSRHEHAPITTAYRPVYHAFTRTLQSQKGVANIV